MANRQVRTVRLLAAPSRPSGGFTLIELLVVVVIMAIAGAMVVPMMVGLGGMEAMSAARMIATDLEYAQNVAITSQTAVTVTFDPAAESYELTNASGVLKHPMRKSNDYVVDFRSQDEFEQVDIVSANFEGLQSVSFDELGSPDHSGQVTVRGGSEMYRVDVAPVTGTVAVTNLGS